MRLKYSLIIAVLLLTTQVQAQELQARVTVLAQKVPTSVNKNIFNTLQTQLTNLLNSRKWTSDEFQPQEKITCNFLITITDMPQTDIYKATLTVQAARPVYNSSYQSPIVNYQDADFAFKYVEFQPVEFNENRVQGTDPIVGNLTATIAYYAYIILGIDYDSYALKSGVPFFQRAQNIVSNAPESRDISGWKAFDGLRNRYWLAENFNNNRYNLLHDAIYSHYRGGLDSMYDNENAGRKNILESLSRLQSINQENPNLMIMQFLMQGKTQEYTGVFKKAAPQDKALAAELLSQIDVANSAKYKQELR
ncbi:type IX secretion system protein PorD [Deminuibacter soli]|uniref:DUF4835 family protein n=1 Tax=Deminuibacter soli TaxID=2291815 RepID=A0A3E1NDK6_9BACT|nr:DUF4835 family protein [Deminuibacter soli]RFM26049.1 DUF4835 family protein [Deminuibacter soli]